MCKCLKSPPNPPDAWFAYHFGYSNQELASCRCSPMATEKFIYGILHEVEDVSNITQTFFMEKMHHVLYAINVIIKRTPDGHEGLTLFHSLFMRQDNSTIGHFTKAAKLFQEIGFSYSFLYDLTSVYLLLWFKLAISNKAPKKHATKGHYQQMQAILVWFKKGFNKLNSYCFTTTKDLKDKEDIKDAKLMYSSLCDTMNKVVHEIQIGGSIL